MENHSNNSTSRPNHAVNADSSPAALDLLVRPPWRLRAGYLDRWAPSIMAPAAGLRSELPAASRTAGVAMRASANGGARTVFPRNGRTEFARSPLRGAERCAFYSGRRALSVVSALVVAQIAVTPKCCARHPAVVGGDGRERLPSVAVLPMVRSRGPTWRSSGRAGTWLLSVPALWRHAAQLVR